MDFFFLENLKPSQLVNSIVSEIYTFGLRRGVMDIDGTPPAYRSHGFTLVSDVGVRSTESK